MKVKEIFYSIQGEGMNAGRPAVFVRFAGCNLWSGREQDRAGAICKFCDTDFRGGESYTIGELVDEVYNVSEFSRGWPLVILTGGEPMLQIGPGLIREFNRWHVEVAIETNGTIAIPEVWGIDWICVSPKAGTVIEQYKADELKLVWPQEGLDPAEFSDGERYMYENLLLQPKWEEDPAARQANIDACIDYIKIHTEWRLSLQTHKLIGVR
jgi:7-carboxy-7-deazaguanine synthase